MTGRERVLAAMRREPVDRVPIMEMAIDWRVVRDLGYRSYTDLVVGLDLDGVSVNQALYLFGWRRLVLPHVKNYVDEWGVTNRFTGELMPVPVGHPVPTPDALIGFRPPRPERSPLLRAIRYVRRRSGDRAIAMLCRNDFSASWFLCGFETLLVSYLEAPEFAERLARLVSDYSVELYRLAIAAGVDVIFLTDDYAFKTGTLMSRPQFERFVLPWLTRGVRAIHDAGGLCVKHTDGDIAEIVDLIVDTGVDAIGPLEPAAGNDLVETRSAYRDRVAVVGNIDVDLLSRGTVDEVKASTRSLVDALSPMGGHVLSSGNTISASVRGECFRAMVEAARGR
jgi:uroporphyrinogen decarboxylase